MSLLGGGSPQCNVTPVLPKKVNVLKILSSETVCDDKALEVPYG